MSMEKLVEQLAARSMPVQEPGDYTKDGLLYCGHCDTPKQCRIKFDFGERVVGCQCACKQRKWEAEQRAKEEREKAIFISHLRANGIRDRSLTACRFETAMETAELAKCRRYAENWPKMRKNNTGLLLWGAPGVGKSFAAACIVNCLVDRGVPAMITSFPRILNAGWNKQEIAEQMRHYDLVVIDDLGVERGSPYALEIVYMVIDERYKSKKPLIVTTNLKLQDMRNPEDVEHSRIYGRILEMSIPIPFRGENIRKEHADSKLSAARKILEG